MATTTNNGWETPDDTDLVKDGALAMRTLGNAIDTSTGQGLLAWQTWAPTLSDGWTNGTGTWVARYLQIGKTVHVRGQFTTGNGTKGTILTCTFPVTATSNISALPLGTGSASIGGVIYPLRVLYQAAGNFRLYAENASATYLTAANITATVPATWAASGDVFRFSFTYEAA